MMSKNTLRVIALVIAVAMVGAVAAGMILPGF